MADDNSEVIGGVSITVTGDYSQLESDLQEAVDQATEAGEQIASAFESSSFGDDMVASLEAIATAAQDVTSAADTTGEAVDSLSGSAGNLGNASQQAGASLDDTTESVDEAGDAAEEAETGFAAFAEALVGVGEALAITEGLSELATEAENAADKITIASIALTTITGSSEEAQSIIEQLEQLGTNEGLAMPSLLTAATRMQQMLGPGTDVVELLGSIGNGAQAMGTDIVAAAQKFDQMAVQGTASARTMQSLGLSLTALASAFNTVSGTAEATQDNVAALFKAMDQAQRIDVLQQALSGLGGVAAQVAQQTFGAQWTILANQWEAVMVEAGNALLPIVSELNQLLRTDVLPFVQQMAARFNELSPAVKDTAVAVALLVGGLAPLTVALGSFGLLVAGIEAAMPALSSAMVALGISSGTAAVGEEAAAVAATHLAEAEGGAVLAAEEGEVAIVGMEAAGAGLSLSFASLATIVGSLAGALLFEKITGGIDAFHNFYAAAVDLATSFTALNTAASSAQGALSPLTSAIELVGTAISGAVEKTGGWTQVWQNFVNVVNPAVPILNAFSTTMEMASGKVQAMNPLMAQMLATFQATVPVFGQSTTGVEGFSTGLATLVTKQAQLNATVAATKQVLQEAQQQYAAGAVGITVVQAATVAYDNAIQAAIPHGKDFASTVAGIEQAAQKAQQAFQSSLAVYQQLAANFDGSAQSAAVLDEAYTKLEASAKKAGQTFADSTGILTQWQTQAKQTATVAEQAAIAMALITTAAVGNQAGVKELIDTYTKWQATAKANGDVDVTAAGQVAKLTDTVLLQEGTLQQNIQAWQKLNAQAQTDQAAMGGAAAAFKLVASEASTLGVNITQVGSGFQVSAKEATPAANAMVALLVQMMNQAGLTTETIQKGIPVYTDGATGVTVYGKALQQTIGTVVDAKTGIVELNAVLPEHADAFNKAAAAAAAHAQALYGVQSAALNVQPSLFNVTEATQKLTQAGQGTVNTFENAISVFNNLASQTNLTMQQQVALENAFKQVQSAGTALGLQVQFVNGQLVVTSQNGNSASTALQGFLQQINSLTSSTPASTAAQDALAQSIKNVGAAAQEAASEIGSFAQDEAAMSGGGGSSGGGGGATGSMQTILEMVAASGGQISSQEAGAAGDILTGNNQLESISIWNAQVAQQVAQLNQALGTTGKYVEQVGTYMDQFGNTIDFAQQILNTNYTPATTSAATSTSDLSTAATAATSAVSGASAAIIQYTDGMNLVNATTATSATVAQQFTDTVNDGSDAVNVSVDSLGNWTTSLASSGEQIQTVGPPTEQAIESLGLSASTAKNLMQLWTSTGQGAVAATANLATAAQQAAGALQSVQSAPSVSPVSSGGPSGGATSSAPTGFIPLSQSATAPASPSAGYTYEQGSAYVNGQLVPGWTLSETGGVSAVTGTFDVSAGPSNAEYGSITNPNTGISTSIGNSDAQMIAQMLTAQPSGPSTQGVMGLTAAQQALQNLALSQDIGGAQFPGAAQLPNLPSNQQGAMPTMTVSNSGNQTINLNVNLSAGTVVGSNGMQTLSQMIQTAITTQLRQQAGLKLS